jgi:proteasome accessory factor A
MASITKSKRLPVGSTYGEPVHAPKILGADVELGNCIRGTNAPGGTGREASRELLREIPGILTPGSPNNPQDWGRKFLATNGGCAYIDSDHLEIALPETFSAYEHVAQWRAMLELVRAATTQVNRRLPLGSSAQVLANCTDGLGHSYGSHVNVLLTRTAWDNIFSRRPHYLGFLAAFQTSSIVYTGQGKVGSENGSPHANFQLSQRADFLETVVGIDTMVHRSLVNSRDEPLCGSGSTAQPHLARLHVIFYDSTLCQVATLLRVGTLQMIAAMIEAERVNPSLALDDPLEALCKWSRDPSLSIRVRTTRGARLSAVELQFRFLEEAKRFADAGGFLNIVPEAERLLAVWEETLLALRARDFPTLGRKLDWVLKLQLLRRVLDQRPDLTWQSAELKHLDQLYASLSETDGLFWAHERNGQVDQVVTEQAITRACMEPPADTRAWTRAQLLRRAGAERVDHVDWDRVALTDKRNNQWSCEPHVIHLPSPFGSTEAANRAHFRQHQEFDDLLEALDSVDDVSPAIPADEEPFRKF